MQTVPECFALLHECQHPNEPVPGPTGEGDQPERNEDVRGVEASDWVRCMRQAAEKRLREWVSANLRPEHYMAAVLNPRLKQLQLICTDIER